MFGETFTFNLVNPKWFKHWASFLAYLGKCSTTRLQEDTSGQVNRSFVPNWLTTLSVWGKTPKASRLENFKKTWQLIWLIWVPSSRWRTLWITNPYGGHPWRCHLGSGVTGRRTSSSGLLHHPRVRFSLDLPWILWQVGMLHEHCVYSWRPQASHVSEMLNWPSTMASCKLTSRHVTRRAETSIGAQPAVCLCFNLVNNNNASAAANVRNDEFR